MSDDDRSRHVAIVGSALAAAIVLAGALTFTFHMGDMSGRKDAEAQGYASAYPNDTSKQISDCWSKPDAKSAQECVGDAIEASHESQRSEQDLSAQRQMSDWAFWALVVATMTAMVTAVGTFMLYQQIVLTRKAVEDTGEATLAMRESNEITSEALKMSYEVERGRLLIVSPDITKSDAGFDIIPFVVSNTGRTAAEIKFYSIYTLSSLPIDERSLFGRRKFAVKDISVPAGMECGLISIRVDERDPILAGWFDYNDIFGKSYTETFIFIMRGGRIDHIIYADDFFHYIRLDREMVLKNNRMTA